MSENYSSILTRCMGLSMLGLLSELLGVLPPLVPFALAMAPLVWYHVGYLRRFAGEGISQPAVDSVYYYGFLVTIGALGVTALKLSIQGVEGDLTSVAFQFGLGLMATGYAVWARIQLTASSRLLDEANLEEAMHKYVERSKELVSAVELATSSFNNFAQTVLTKTESFSSRVEQETKASIDAASAEMKGAVSSMAEESKLALRDLRGIINDTTFGAERAALKAGVTSMVETVNELSSALSELKSNSSAGAETVGAFANNLGMVSNNASSAAAKLEVLGQKDGPFDKFGEGLATGRTQLDEFALSADLAGVAATSISDKISVVNSDLASLSSAARKGVGALSKLETGEAAIADFASELAAAADSLQGTASAASKSQATFHDVALQLVELKATLENLNSAILDSTGGLKDSMIETSEALENHLQLAVSRVAELSKSIEEAHVLELANAEASNGTA